MHCTIFYSWQSDSPSSTNRGLIGDALELAAKAIRNDDSVTVEPVIDRDTSGVAGSPEISNTIFQKIADAQIFVGDVSIINPKSKLRRTPNPNVLIELGYAMRAVGPERIIMVLNTAFGTPEQLPFDLKMRRIVPYTSAPEDTDRATARKDLAKKLESQLRLMLTDVEQQATTSNAATQRDEAMAAIRKKLDDRVLALRAYLTYFWDRVIAIGATPPATADDLVSQIAATPDLIVEFEQLVRMVSVMDDQLASEEIFRSFSRVLSRYAVPKGHTGTYRESDFDYFRFVGHECFVTFAAALIRERRWTLLDHTLDLDIQLIPRPAFSERVTGRFCDLSERVRLLGERSKATHRISVHADLLNERHTSEPLAQITPFDEFLSADYFLFLRGESTEDSSFFTAWVPRSAVYMHAMPELFIHAKKKAAATEVATALRLSGIDELRALMRSSANKLQEMFGPYWDIFFLSHGVDEVGSK